MHELLARVARSQAGLFTRAQAAQCGYSAERIRTELRNHRWLVVIAGVYRFAGTPGGWNTRVWSGLLTAGPRAVLAGRAAGHLHRIDGVPGYERLEIAVPANRRPRKDVGSIVRSVPLRAADVERRRGIPVLTAERTVSDLARLEPIEVGAHIIADSLRTGVAHPARLAEHLELARSRVGAARARASFALADPTLESVLERELFTLLTGAGLRVEPQFEVVQLGTFIARLDFAIQELRLGFESDGYGVHSLRPAFERDRERHALLQLAGWVTVSFTATQIRQRPSWVQQVSTQLVRQRCPEFGKTADAYCG